MKADYFSLLTLCLIYFCNFADGLQFTDCGSIKGKFTKIIISDCDTTADACILKRGTDASITIDFTLSEWVYSAKTVVHGKILGMDFPFALKNPDACVNTGLKCPMEPKTSYEYKAVLPVLKSYPKVSVLVKWEIVDTNNKTDVVCVEIPAKIA